MEPLHFIVPVWQQKNTIISAMLLGIWHTNWNFVLHFTFLSLNYFEVEVSVSYVLALCFSDFKHDSPVSVWY